jgi:hypothetical protein
MTRLDQQAQAETASAAVAGSINTRPRSLLDLEPRKLEMAIAVRFLAERLGHEPSGYDYEAYQHDLRPDLPGMSEWHDLYVKGCLIQWTDVLADAGLNSTWTERGWRSWDDKEPGLLNVHDSWEEARALLTEIGGKWPADEIVKVEYFAALVLELLARLVPDADRLITVNTLCSWIGWPCHPAVHHGLDLLVERGLVERELVRDVCYGYRYSPAAVEQAGGVPDARIDHLETEFVDLWRDHLEAGGEGWAYQTARRDWQERYGDRPGGV